MEFFLKLSYLKVGAFFYLPRQGWPFLVDTYSVCNVSFTLRYMFTYVQSIAFHYYSRLAHVLNVEQNCIRISMCFSDMNNNNTHIAAIAPLPLTTHPW